MSGYTSPPSWKHSQWPWHCCPLSILSSANNNDNACGGDEAASLLTGATTTATTTNDGYYYRHRDDYDHDDNPSINYPFCFFSSCGQQRENIVVGNAFDLIVYYNDDDDDSSTACSIACNDVMVTFGTTWFTSAAAEEEYHRHDVVLEITKTTKPLQQQQQEEEERRLLFPVVDNKLSLPMEEREPIPLGCTPPMEDRRRISKIQQQREEGDDETNKQTTMMRHHRMALIKLLRFLQPHDEQGDNTKISARYLLLERQKRDGYHGTTTSTTAHYYRSQHRTMMSRLRGIAPVDVFLWPINEHRLVVVDIDGTITRSNARGLVDTILTDRYADCHEGICQFFSALAAGTAGTAAAAGPENNTNVEFLYLTSRPLVIANMTRRFLSKLRQRQEQHSSSSHHPDNKDFRMPPGPLIGYSGPVVDMIRQEADRTIHKHKTRALRQNIIQVFSLARRSGGIATTTFEQDDDDAKTNQNAVPNRHHPAVVHAGDDYLFMAGFGNTGADMRAYHAAGMQLHQLYHVNPQSRICCLDKNRHQHHPSQTQQHQEETTLSKSSSGVGNEPISYKLQRGTLFERGYEDDRLLAHVLGGCI